MDCHCEEISDLFLRKAKEEEMKLERQLWTSLGGKEFQNELVFRVERDEKEEIWELVRNEEKRIIGLCTPSIWYNEFNIIDDIATFCRPAWAKGCKERVKIPLRDVTRICCSTDYDPWQFNNGNSWQFRFFNFKPQSDHESE